MDSQAGTLGLASLVGMEPHWGPSLGLDHGISEGTDVVEVGVLDCLMVSPQARKRVMPGGNVGSPLSSSLMLNLTCLLGFSSTWGPALPHLASGLLGPCL